MRTNLRKIFFLKLRVGKKVLKTIIRTYFTCSKLKRPKVALNEIKAKTLLTFGVYDINFEQVQHDLGCLDVAEKLFQYYLVFCRNCCWILEIIKEKENIGMNWVNTNPLSANPTKWSTTLKQFGGCCRQIVWICLTILWGWFLKG